MVINKKIPVYKSVWMNKTKFFIIHIVPAIYFLLLKIFVKLYYFWSMEHRNFTSVKTKQQLLIIFPDFHVFQVARNPESVV